MKTKQIVLVEPFYGGSHKQWADQLAEHSGHQFTFLTLPDRHWKWRMHGAAITLADRFNQLGFIPELIVVTDMLDLNVFKSLINKSAINVPIVLYMHENQINYPWSPEDEDVKLNRDRHYGFINYTSALVADYVCFNSDYHRIAFLGALPEFLSPFPDYQNLSSVDQIRSKSQTLYLGLELPKTEFETSKKGALRIAWNHRWEYDKGIEDFGALLDSLVQSDVEFELVMLGESFGKYPKAFDQLKESHASRIVHWGFVDSRQEYFDWLGSCDLLPVTSRQDFFGISIVEAIAAGCVPLLPNRLSYPELIPEQRHSSLLYNSPQELINGVQSISRERKNDYNDLREYLRQFEWENIISTYDDFFDSVIK